MDWSRRIMVQIASCFKKLRHRLTLLRLRPVRVFCLHHVSEKNDPFVYCAGDWISLDSFKHTIKFLRSQRYHFISLREGHRKIATDIFRLRKYAILTFDDGYKSSLPAYSWLEENNIPYTLFINAKYLDGVSISDHIVQHAHTIRPDVETADIAANLYLTEKDLHSLSSDLSSVGSHGLEHIDATTLSDVGFKEQIQRNFNIIQDCCPINQIPFHAYTWGRHSDQTDSFLYCLGITPVLIDGAKNYNDPRYIHRELLPI